MTNDARLVMSSLVAAGACLMAYGFPWQETLGIGIITFVATFWLVA